MDPCHRIRKIISAYQDNEIEGVQKAAIQAHLHICEGCRNQYEILQQTYQLLKKLPDIEADESLAIKVLERVSHSQQSVWTRIKDDLRQLLPAHAPTVALAIFGILLGTLVGNFWIEQDAFFGRTIPALQSNLTLTIASERAFDAVPAGSFSEGYLQLATYNPEPSHAK
jgi:predicted anti-sigma-YlaC factor YlaD